MDPKLHQMFNQNPDAGIFEYNLNADNLSITLFDEPVNHQ